MSRDSELEIGEDSQSGGIPLETLLQTIHDQFEHLVEIHVAHLPTPSEVSKLLITVHAGDATSLEEYLDVSSATYVTIDTGKNPTKRLPYTVVATFDSPGHVQGTDGTTVYCAENVLGAGTRDLETGLARLRQKLSGTCPTCGMQTKRLSQHYNEARECAEAELLV